jgi:multidrug efflux pump subunit AcrA (membrane-fusion protein)
MKRWLVIGLVIAVLGGAGFWGYGQYLAAQEAAVAAQAAEEAAQAEDLEQVIWASGKLQPLTWAGLAPAGSGTVQKIYAAEGDAVQAGDLLLELENGVLQSQVAVAEAARVEAQTALAKLRAQAPAADVAAAEAAVEAARAQVAIAASQMQDVESALSAAQVGVDMARARYAEVASHPTEAERLAARAAIAQAEAGVANAQAGYNLVKDDPAIGARPESLALSQATAALEVANAQAAVTAAGPTAEQLAVAATAIREAQTAVAAAQDNQAGAEANVRAALAQAASAEAALDKLLAGATPEDIAMAEARVQSAQAAVDSAKAQLRMSQVYAPFDGTVGAVNVRPGELLAPGTYAILLGDTAAMHVETTDLRETDVVRVQVGMPVEVTFDAAPDRIFRGIVTQVAPVSSAERGSTNYTVDVEVEELDPGLRWGMTAFVNIRPLD